MSSELIWLAMKLGEALIHHSQPVASPPVLEIMITANSRCPLSMYGRSSVSLALFWLRKVLT